MGMKMSSFPGEVPQDTKEWANSEGSAELDERSGEDSEEEGGRSRHESQQALKVPQKITNFVDRQSIAPYPESTFYLKSALNLGQVINNW
jgi:hypothetical protein